jgi:uncharacterized protein
MSTTQIEIFLLSAGLIAGLIDSVAGFLIYLKNGMRSHGAWTYSLWIGLGAFLGSRLAHLIPPKAFVWVLLVTCPTILALIWRRDFLLKLSHERSPQDLINISRTPAFILTGLLCGLYDGIWGPGGGTFMFLSLLLVVKLPLAAAILISKLANTASAGIALVSFLQLGQVQWPTGLLMAAAAGFGSYIGAEFVSRQAARVLRPVLTTVVVLLLIRVVAEFGT